MKETFEERRRLSKEIYERFKGSVSLDVVWVKGGVPSLECSYDESIASRYVIEEVKRAQGKYDAIVIDCFFEPSLDACREISEIPVIGPNHSSGLLASQLCNSFSIISPERGGRRIVVELAKKHGYYEKLSSIRFLGTGVLSIEKDLEGLLDRAYQEAVKAIEEGAEGIVLGCTGLSILAEGLRRWLKEDGYEIPVIEPLRAAISNAISISFLKISHSRLSFPEPKNKEVI